MEKGEKTIGAIIDRHEEFYKEIVSGKNTIRNYLENNEITILDGFIQNINNVREFYKRVYHNDNNPRIVFCGINPGRNGAGITGIPFFDKLSLSKILDCIQGRDCERSAQFMWSVISRIGIDDFFNNVYLTNACWFGFMQDGKNYNYYKLDNCIKQLFLNEFVKEMEIVQPSIIFSLGEEVFRDIKELKQKYDKNWKLTILLNIQIGVHFLIELTNGVKSILKQ